MWAPRYWPSSYWAGRYWPPGAVAVAYGLLPEIEILLSHSGRLTLVEAASETGLAGLYGRTGATVEDSIADLILDPIVSVLLAQSVAEAVLDPSRTRIAVDGSVMIDLGSGRGWVRMTQEQIDMLEASRSRVVID